MADVLNRIPRVEKRDIARKIADNLKDRAQSGPAEPALDAYINDLEDVHGALDEHVGGGVLADATRTAQLALLDAADDDVDTWLRHIESYLSVEAGRRIGPHIVLIKAAHEAAFPDGLSHVDDPVADENRLCRDSLAVLRSEEHAAAVTASGMPAVWLTNWETALDASDAALAAVEKSRQDRRTHVGLGRDAETDWAETMVRLRKYIGSRAGRGDAARLAEGKALLSPLLTVITRMKAAAATRATRRRQEESPAPASIGSSGSAPS